MPPPCTMTSAGYLRPAAHVLREIQEALDVEPVERSIRHFLRLEDVLPFDRRFRQLTGRPADPGKVLDTAAVGGRGSHVDEPVAFRGFEAAQSAFLVGQRVATPPAAGTDHKIGRRAPCRRK